MQNERKKLEELNLLDDFLFNAMMTYPEMGEKFTRKILKLLFNKEFRNLKVIAQKSYGGLNTDLRGARLDVYVESDDSAEIDALEDVSIYDLEPDKNDKAKYVAAFPQEDPLLSCHHRQPQSEIRRGFWKVKESIRNLYL